MVSSGPCSGGRVKAAYFGLLGDGRICYALAINSLGQIVGQMFEKDMSSEPFLWSEGELTELGTLGGRRASATAVNELGQVIGWSTMEYGGLDSHAFIWKDGLMQDLDGTGLKSSRAYGINDAGQVVGYAQFAGKRAFAFLWEEGELVNLNERVASSPGWRLICADAINDRGQIVAFGINDEKKRACLLSLPTSDLTKATATASTIIGAGRAERTSAMVSDETAPFDLNSLERLPGDRFRLGFRGQPGAEYFIEVSTDLVQWTRLGSAANRDGNVEFIDENVSGFTLRFYRAVLAP
ncbi:MAG TPA: hypothetical protein EYQ50_00550 [Verrucomicrobiales bacterium]|nr:hypothetical protein [Verrucomicrobiales bacterium]